jgi:hypothetical protein
MSQALCDIIPIMILQQEMREQTFKVVYIEPHVYCKVFEDNTGAPELVRLPKLCPRTKHINICYHHFCTHVHKGLIKIFPINLGWEICLKFCRIPQLIQSWTF